jgi:acetylornithine deacetylase/succinyl-diaminopimelate desuccinylase-like protein
MAHTDTVFPAQTNLTINRNNGTIHGPGLGDNSIGVSGVMGLVYWLREQDITPACDLWLVATSREEGLGNLDGARLAYETLKNDIGAVINVEGLAYGYIYHAGIAVRRLNITAYADGGHSWLHYGKASAIHEIVQLAAKITTLNPSTNPRTTYNIGIIEGGHSINSIATQASIWLDMRSEETRALIELENTVRALIEEAKTDDVKFTIEVVGDRPAGQISKSHPLIQGAIVALEETGVRGILQVGSTDGNIPLSDGCPTVTIGITRGGNAHRTDEFIETAPVKEGMRQLIALTLAAAEHQTNSEQ